MTTANRYQTESFGKVQRACVRALERRRAFLAGRIATWRGPVEHSSFDRAERQAIDFALQIIAAADQHGILSDLYATAVSRED